LEEKKNQISSLETQLCKLKKELSALSLQIMHETLPKGFVVVEVTDEYYGSHEECGEGEYYFIFAVPLENKEETKNFRFAHGHNGAATVPKKPSFPVFVWGDGWSPFTHWSSN